MKSALKFTIWVKKNEYDNRIPPPIDNYKQQCHRFCPNIKIIYFINSIYVFFIFRETKKKLPVVVMDDNAFSLLLSYFSQYQFQPHLY